MPVEPQLELWETFGIYAFRTDIPAQCMYDGYVLRVKLLSVVSF